MPLRRIAVVLGLAVLAACRPDVGERSSPSQVDYAVFDPTTSRIPLPNDLALKTAATLPAGAQKEFLGLLVAAGGFPNDQEVPITIQFVRQPVGGAAAPLALDLASLKFVGAVAPGQANIAVMRVDGTPTPVPVDPAIDATTGTLTLHNKPQPNGSRAWTPGAKYAVFVRGGDAGVKTQDGGTVEPMPTFAILRGALVNNLDLSQPVNQALLPGSATEKLAAGTQLEGIRQAYRPLVPLATGIGIPMAEVVDLQTFQIAPLSATSPTVVEVDESAGSVPLPFDLLRDPNTGKIVNNPAFGPAAAGLATLDGFSTTAMILAPTSSPIDGTTVNGGSVILYKLGAAGAAPTVVKELKATLGAGGNGAEAGYVAQPGALTGSPVIGLQPATPAPVPSVGTFYLPPLQEKTSYAVVVTDRVKDVAGKTLGRSTFAKIILAVESPVFQNGVSQLAGVPNDQAQAIEQMRTELTPVFAALPSGVAKTNVVMAYTFKTQSITETSLALSAAPYSIEAGAKAAIFTPDLPPTAVAAPGGVPTTNVAGFFDVRFKSIDAIDKSTGALRPTLAADLANAAVVPTLLTELHALVAVPDAAVVPACPAPFPAGTKCARLVVFGHGLNGSKETLFPIASSLASAGFVAAAIDFPLHGARNWCKADADCGGGGTCDKSGPFAQSAGQGDCGTFAPGSAECTALRPGVCSGGTGPALGAARFFLTQNFFRMRDAFRQNLFDQSALALALSRPPAPVPQPAQNPFTAVLPTGVLIDPTEIYYEGISLGSISGTSVLATNPRLTRGALSVGGGTFIDIGVTSPTISTALAPLFTALLQDVLPAGTPFSFAMIDPTSGSFLPAVAAAFLKLENVAKWVQDPGDPINYAAHVKLAPLPNLLANPNGSVAQPAKAAYGQIATGDTTVPNPTNGLLYSLMMGGLPGVTTTYDGAGASHSMLATQALVQTDAAGFLVDPTANVPPTTRTLP